MKNANGTIHQSSAGVFAGMSRLLALSALSLYALAIPVSSQQVGNYKIAAEKGFTVVPNVQTPIVLKTMPDAECDLHAAGGSEAGHKLRIYANGEGYVQVHAKAKQELADGIEVQLDCRANGKAVRYPLHVRASSSPTRDMPAPQTEMPTPKGSQVMPALSEQEAEQFSDEELISRGFPPRPDASTSPEAYAKWRELVSQPMTMVPPHLVSRTDIVRSAKRSGQSQQGEVQNSFGTSGNWSGYVDFGSYRGFDAVYGQWNIPSVVACESNNTTYSSFWVGLDGYASSDLVQDGTEHDCTDIAGFLNFYSYSAWEELLPNQPYSQNVSLSINPGDSFWALAWVGDANHNYNPNGAYAWFNMWDTTKKQGVLVGQALNGTVYYGEEAEWIMERPTLSNGHFAELSDYGSAVMSYPEVMNSSFNWSYYLNYSNQQIFMYNGSNYLSAASGLSSTSIAYYWYRYH